MFDKDELDMIEHMGNLKLLHISHTIERGITETMVYSFAVDQKPIVESIIEKVRKM